MAPHYVTEKVWDAIALGCLPIYAGSDTIYRTLPWGSFIDAREFATASDLFAFVNAISFAEYRDRVNKLRAIYGDLLPRNLKSKSRERAFDILRSFLRSHLARA